MRESIHGKVRAPENAKAIEYGRRAGYATGGAVTIETPASVKKAVHKHENHDHPGTELTKLKHGGKAPGGAAAKRLDKRARGGRVNIIIKTGAGDGEKQELMQKGMKTGAMMTMKALASKMGGGAPGAGGPPMPGAPPGGPMPMVGGPPGGAPPGGAPQPMGPPMRADGGRVTTVREHTRRCRGGSVEE